LVVDLHVNERKALFGHYGQTCLRKVIREPKEVTVLEDEEVDVVSTGSNSYDPDLIPQDSFEPEDDNGFDNSSNQDETFIAVESSSSVFGILPTSNATSLLVDASYLTYQKLLYTTYTHPETFLNVSRRRDGSKNKPQLEDILDLLQLRYNLNLSTEQANNILQTIQRINKRNEINLC
jgi:hypothetical protein